MVQEPDEREDEPTEPTNGAPEGDGDAPVDDGCGK